jgi:acrylyl-CoA reductase (NADPH)
MKFKALRIIEVEKNIFDKQFIERYSSELTDNEVLIRVHYSSLNYKDALSASGNKGVSRNFPHTPGIDASGVVVSSKDTRWKEGDHVLVTSYDLGMSTDGGFGQLISVPSRWVIQLPNGLSLADAMRLGTAGLTAAMCVDKLLKNGLKPEDGDVVVTGATGGVGTLAVMLLAKLGFQVVAVSGKQEAEVFLKNLGAKKVITREDLNDDSARPLLKGIYAGGIDTVGGNMLVTLLKSVQYNASVAICGLVNSAELHTTVFPFILRGLSLFGVDSAEASLAWRTEVWHKLANEWKLDNLESITKTVQLEEIIPEIDKILAGGQMGRILVDLQN